MWSLEHFRVLLLVTGTLYLFEPGSSYSLAPGSPEDQNKCLTEILPQNKVIVSWRINVGKLTPDSYAGICFGKIQYDELQTGLCWNKTSKAFVSAYYTDSLFFWRKGKHLENPQAKENPDGSVTVSVEMSSSRYAGQTVFWDVLWAEKMHNKVINEILHCTYTVENAGCGTKAQQTVWGTMTRPGSWPWQVSLKQRFMGHSCGGSIIGQRWILTAAHCFDGQSHKDFTVVAGEHHLYTTDGLEQEISIERLFKHPRYNMSSNHNYDMALLKLAKTLQYNDRVTPICLPEMDFDPGTKCFVTGWGTIASSVKRAPKVLKQAKLPLVPRIPCKRSYRDWQSLGFRVTKRMRCAGYPKGGVGACQSDNGGPLTCEKNRRWYLLGVASWGAGCGQDGYGVYADVFKLKKWIHRTMKDS